MSKTFKTEDIRKTRNWLIKNSVLLNQDKNGSLYISKKLIKKIKE